MCSATYSSYHAGPNSKDAKGDNQITFGSTKLSYGVLKKSLVGV